MLEPSLQCHGGEAAVIFKPRRGWSPVPALLALTPSLVPLKVSQGPAPACTQRGGCECPQPGSHSGPCGGGVLRWHKPATATTLPRGHFWLLCGLREWAPRLRYDPSAFWAPQPWDLSKPHWCLLAVVRCFFWSLAEQQSSGLREPLIERTGVLPTGAF